MSDTNTMNPTSKFSVPTLGAGHPGSPGVTTPGSFANKPDIGGPLAFSSPDTPGMPKPSDKTAWDFLPDDWSILAASDHATGCKGHNKKAIGEFIRCVAPAGFTPVTQLESARLGVITPEMTRVAEREPHLTAEQVRAAVT